MEEQRAYRLNLSARLYCRRMRHLVRARRAIRDAASSVSASQVEADGRYYRAGLFVAESMGTWQIIVIDKRYRPLRGALDRLEDNLNRSAARLWRERRAERCRSHMPFYTMGDLVGLLEFPGK